MGDHQPGEPLVDQPPDQLEQLHLVPHVERRGRLVEHQDRRLLGQRAGQPDPLPLAAGERVDRARRERVRVAALERGRAPPPGRRRPARRAGRAARSGRA